MIKTDEILLKKIDTSFHQRSLISVFQIWFNVYLLTSYMTRFGLWIFMSKSTHDFWPCSIVCFTILVLPVLLDEEYWSFQYRVFYNTSITSIVGWRMLELPVLCIDQRFWYSSIVNARYWYTQYCICMILVLPVL